MGKWVHRLIEKDETSMQGVCAACGPVRLIRASDGGVRCSTRERTRKARRRRARLGEGPFQCAICHRDLLASGVRLDHDHVTGEQRGLLCNSCNLGLGYFQDDPVRLQAAIQYLS